MNYDIEIQNLKARLDSLQESFIQFGINNTNTVSKADETSNKVEQITPYTDTKTAYYGDTSVTFYDAPQGRVSVFIDGYGGGYSVSRESSRLIVAFDALDKQTEVTISIQ